jgi:multiple sugar transport system permease protein
VNRSVTLVVTTPKLGWLFRRISERRMRRRTYDSAEVRLAYGLLAPGLVVLLGVLAFPLVYALRLSLSQVNANGEVIRFVWFANYVDAVKSPEFLPSLERTLYFAGVVLVGTVVLGFAMGLLLTVPFPGRSFVRGLLVVPWSLSATVVALLTGWIVNQQLGTLNGLLKQLHIIRSPIAWFDVSGWRSLTVMAVAVIWATAPFAAMLYLGALQTVPDELLRAARVDGAGALRRFFAVTVPWVRRTTFLVSVLGVIAGFTMFIMVFILTNGGPGSATNVLPWFAYTTAFTDLNWGVGSALFFLIAVSVFVISGILFAIFARNADA